MHATFTQCLHTTTRICKLAQRPQPSHAHIQSHTYPYTCTHMHVYISAYMHNPHSYTHAHTDSHSHPCAYICTLAQPIIIPMLVHTQVHTHMHTHTHTLTHTLAQPTLIPTLMHTQAPPPPCTCTHSHTSTLAQPTLIPTLIHTQAPTPSHAHAHTRTHPHMHNPHLQAHMLTLARMCSRWVPWCMGRGAVLASGGTQCSPAPSAALKLSLSSLATSGELEGHGPLPPTLARSLRHLRTSPCCSGLGASHRDNGGKCRAPNWLPGHWGSDRRRRQPHHVTPAPSPFWWGPCDST